MLKVYGVTLRAPAITTRQSSQHDRIGLIITNSQSMYICDISVFYSI